MSSKELREKYKDVIPATIPVFPGRRMGKGDQRRLVPRSRAERGPRCVSLTPATDIVGTKKSGRPIGLLLVAAPVLLVAWMIIWPIISAIGRTIWLPDEGGAESFSLETYRFFFTDQYSLNNLSVTLWTTGVCALLLVLICLPIALYLRFAKGRSPPMCRASRSFRCSCPRSS
jgi:hypothetical protein